MKVYIGMGQAKFSNILNRLLHEVLGCAPAVILKIFFCEVIIFQLLEDLPPYQLLYAS
jgi:uncharacterized protein YbcI